MKVLRCIPLAALAAVSLAACGGGTDLGDELSDAEAAEVLATLSAIYFPSPSAPTPTSPLGGPALVTTLIQDTSQVTITCASGGSALVLNTDSISYTSNVRINPTPDTTYVSEAAYSGRTRSEIQYMNCASRGGSNGVWTFNAVPGLAMTYDLTGEIYAAGFPGGGSSSSTTSSLDGLWSGTLGWSNGGRSGQCQFSFQMASTSSYINGVSAYTYNQSGVICGISISSNVSS